MSLIESKAEGDRTPNEQAKVKLLRDRGEHCKEAERLRQRVAELEAELDRVKKDFNKTLHALRKTHEVLYGVWSEVKGDVGGEPHLISAAALYGVRAALQCDRGD